MKNQIFLLFKRQRNPSRSVNILDNVNQKQDVIRPLKSPIHSSRKLLQNKEILNGSPHFSSPFHYESNYDPFSFNNKHNITKKYFFIDLLNQMPYGVCIIQNNDTISYSNVSFFQMLNIRNTSQIKDVLSNLENCYQLFEEQAMFNQLFEMLNKKFLNYTQKKEEDSQETDNYIKESYESKSQSALEELQNIRNDIKKKISNSLIHDRSNEIEFQYEVKMICQFTTSPGQKNKNQLFQIIFKPFVRHEEAHILIMIKDVTLFNEISALESINSNKSKMLAQVAHEIRTPLNGIIIMTEDRMETSSENLRKEYLQPVLSSSKWLLSLVNDILDLAQLNAGKFKLTLKSFDIRQLLIEIVSMMIVQTNFKGIELDLLIPQIFPNFIQSDPNRIKQILINLTSNSIKFTPKGGKITIGAEVSFQNQINLFVIDTGVGIEKEDQSKLFQAFGKLERTSNINTSGIGLGLMICNILAIKLSQKGSTLEKYQGLKVYSEGKGKGSKFSFQIIDHLNQNSLVNLECSLVQQKVQCQESSSFVPPSIESEGIIIRQKHITSKKDIFIRSCQIFAEGRKDSTKIRMTQILKKNEEQVLYRFEMQSNKKQVAMVKQKAKNPGRQSVELDVESVQKSESTSPKIEQIKSDQFNYHICYQILIIDDIATNIIPLKNFLTRKDITCIETFSGIEAIELLRKCEECFQIILIDIEMPGLNGIDVTKIIRKQFQKQYYIIGCSGYSEEQEKQLCLDAGMNDYLEKPINLKELYDKLQLILIL